MTRQMRRISRDYSLPITVFIISGVPKARDVSSRNKNSPEGLASGEIEIFIITQSLRSSTVQVKRPYTLKIAPA